MPADHTPWTLTARWMFPADRSPLADGVVTIQDDKIVAVEAAGARKADVDLGNTAILPGLVNAHTHLDLSDARGKIPPSLGFIDWLREVIKHRRAQTAEQVQQAISDGIKESSSFGVTLVGDIASNGDSWDQLTKAPLWAVVYRELLGLTEQRANDALTQAQTWVEAHPATATCRPGLSPHALYSVRESLFMGAADIARRHDLPVATHIGESPNEIFALGGLGPLVDLLKELGAWDPSGLIRRSDTLLETYRGLSHVTLVHANYLFLIASPDWIHDMPRVVCPRTREAFRFSGGPLAEMEHKKLCGPFVLGTDSLASNPDLDILAEARFVAARHPDLPGETLLRMITLDSAIALGWGDVTGSLTPGKSAELIVLPLPDREEEDPYRLVFDSTSSVQRVCFRGKWIQE